MHLKRIMASGFQQCDDKGFLPAKHSVPTGSQCGFSLHDPAHNARVLLLSIIIIVTKDNLLQAPGLLALH